VKTGGVIEEWPGTGKRGELSIVSSGAFASEGARILLIAADVPRGTSPGTVPAEVWALDAKDAAIRQIGKIPISVLGWPVFRRNSIDDGKVAPVWSPDGQWVLVEEGLRATDQAGPGYKLSAQNGDLRLFLPAARNLLGVLIVP